MGKIWMPGGGGGADLDVVTAGRPDVLTGKVIVDKDGEPLTGTMPDRGAISTSLGINGNYTIPEGYHNGSGKVTQSIATMGGQTINPNASQQTVSSSGKYMTGNVVVNAVSNLAAANIKKGTVVGGVTGTFEGYVPTANDLYIRGTNRVSQWYYVQPDTFHFESGSIYHRSTGGTPEIAAYANLTGYNYLNAELYCSISRTIQICVHSADIYSTKLVTTSSTFTGGATSTISVNVSAIAAKRLIGLLLSASADIYIYRIWLS